MDEEEFEKVMGNVEKVLERSPVYKPISQAEGDFQVRKFSEEEYRLQIERYESDRRDFLDAFSPIIPPEYLMEIENLTTEFATVYGGTEIDTTGWREIMHRASQDALAQGTGTLNCSSPQQITVNQASILSVPSIATIMGWFRGSGIQQSAPCGSCCLECCRCTDYCYVDFNNDVLNKSGEAIIGGIFCLFTGPAYGICFAGVFVYYFYGINNAGRKYNTCNNRCKNRQDCKLCSDAYYNYGAGDNCDVIWRGRGA